MTNNQAGSLRAGDRVKRKGSDDDGTIYVVERIERIPGRYVDIAVHAGDQIFMPSEIVRCGPLQGWPVPR